MGTTNRTVSSHRYETMRYNRVGTSGLKLPAVSLGMWHNFGERSPFENQRALACTAFDLGITHFDLADNYGPPGGAAETNMGKILRSDLAAHRDELIISTKAGHHMWNGPYGNWGSRKHMICGLNQSLKRLQLDYVDIYYHHRHDPETPIEETMGALASVVQQGKALYVGISNYETLYARQAIAILKKMNTPCLIDQQCYNLFDRYAEKHGLFQVLEETGTGCIAFSPLAQGLLAGRYLNGIPAGSRAATPGTCLDAARITPALVHTIQRLNDIAQARSQTLAQMALCWVLRMKPVASVLIGASSPEQLIENAAIVNHRALTGEELHRIEQILYEQ
ncbi:MAG: aldo/keto reductase [Pontiellaceae bacterium]|jgi:L-glyceraldehyde 3-phosphate reductase|nr:aldo/keto reductase [Pontiellaceae bacterium]